MNHSISRPQLAPAVALALGGLLLATALMSPPAHAGSPATPPAFEVQVGDLDLNREAGVAVLYQRLRVAAQRVCGPADVTGTRLGVTGRKACVDGAVENAVQQMNRPALTAYHQSHAARGDTEKS